MKKYINILIISGVFLSGLFSGISGFKYFISCASKFLYINPNLGCGKKYIIDKSHPINLKENLIKFIGDQKKEGLTSDVSVYFRDLYNGPIFGIDEDQKFISASLLKLPIALTFLKMEEEEGGGRGSSLLEREFHFEGEFQESEKLNQFFKPSKSITPGTTYTVEDLIFYSLVYSDNLSNVVLQRAVKSIKGSFDPIFQVLNELGLVLPDEILDKDISTRAYASVFRQLYNSSYLSLEHSEKILGMLSKSSFDLGIAAGVPGEIVVANKFGERDNGDEKQLHDCGIVYYPENPYLLCVLTRGKDFQELGSIISTISKMVYEEFDSRKIR